MSLLADCRLAEDEERGSGLWPGDVSGDDSALSPVCGTISWFENTSDTKGSSEYQHTHTHKHTILVVRITN